MNYVESLVGIVVTTIVGAITWLIRTVLTSQKQIALLQGEIKDRDKRRDEDRQFWYDLKVDLKSELKGVKDDIEAVKSQVLEVWKHK